MFDGEIGGKNINQLALMQGLAVPNPNIMNPKQPAYMMNRGGGPGFGHPVHRQAPVQMSNPMHEWDADYLEYGGHHPRPPMTNQQRPPLRRPNQGLPVPGGYNPVKIPDNQIPKASNKKGNR